ncbi:MULTISPECIES: hypothetical protein [Bacillus cereus group]|nr:hypothetical protein [Bacillus cereus]PFJ30600.1 hypothetical protein COI92_06305 [Bacillus anthracis]PGW00658.1 hypothetical protein COD87_30770 [Bacillus cereus]TKH73438.1 hypothetical protein FC676_11540 [Bacillus cereus]
MLKKIVRKSFLKMEIKYDKEVEFKEVDVLQEGQVLQHFIEDKLKGTYAINRMNLGNSLGEKYALINLNGHSLCGEGVLGKLFDTMDELRLKLIEDGKWIVLDIELHNFIAEELS